MAAGLIALLEPIQADFKASKEWQDVEAKAYPPPVVVKKEKKVKDKGSRHPGAGAAKGVVAKPDGHVEGKGQNEVSLAESAAKAMENLDVAAK